MGDAGISPGQPADPVGRLFWNLGAPEAYYASENDAAGNQIVVNALLDFVHKMARSNLPMSNIAEFYLLIAKKALGDLGHTADHFIQDLATAAQRFPLASLPSVSQSLRDHQETPGEGPKKDHPDLLPLEARWHRFAEWSAQGRQDGYKEEALTTDWQLGLTKNWVYEEALDKYASMGLPSAGPSNCAFCMKENPDFACHECCVMVDGAHLQTQYCSETCRTKHLNAHGNVCRTRKEVFKATSLIHAILRPFFRQTYYRPTGRVVASRQGILVVSYPRDVDRYTRAATPESMVRDDHDGPDWTPLGMNEMPPPVLNRDYRDNTLALSPAQQRRSQELSRVGNNPRAFVGGLVIGRFPAKAVNNRHPTTLTRPGLPHALPRGHNYCGGPGTSLGSLTQDVKAATQEALHTLGGAILEGERIKQQILQRNMYTMDSIAQRVMFHLDGEAAIYYGESAAALAYGMPLLSELLMPMCSNIEVVIVSPKNARVSVTWCGRQLTPIRLGGPEDERAHTQPGDTVRNNMFFDHHVLRVTLATDERFAIDFTGGQYGWKEQLCLWEQYESQRVHRIKSIQSFPLETFKPPSPREYREGIAHQLRLSVMNRILARIRDPIPNFNSIRPMFDEGFHMTKYRWGKIINAAIRGAKRAHRRSGVNRLYLDEEGVVQVTTTPDQGAYYRRVWLAPEEFVKTTLQQYGPMLRLWKLKCGDQRPVTPPFDPPRQRRVWQ